MDEFKSQWERPLPQIRFGIGGQARKRMYKIEDETLDLLRGKVRKSVRDQAWNQVGEVLVQVLIQVRETADV